MWKQWEIVNPFAREDSKKMWALDVMSFREIWNAVFVIWILAIRTNKKQKQDKKTIIIWNDLEHEFKK